MIDHQSEKNDCFGILELSFIKLYDCIMDNLYLSNPVIVRVKSKAQSYFCVLINNNNNDIEMKAKSCIHCKAVWSAPPFSTLSLGVAYLAMR